MGDTSDMKTWLEAAGLSNYFAQSIAEGFDDISILPMMSEDDVRLWAKTVGMKTGHTIKLVQAWKDSVQSSGDLIDNKTISEHDSAPKAESDAAPSSSDGQSAAAAYAALVAAPVPSNDDPTTDTQSTNTNGNEKRDDEEDEEATLSLDAFLGEDDGDDNCDDDGETNSPAAAPKPTHRPSQSAPIHRESQSNSSQSSEQLPSSKAPSPAAKTHVEVKKSPDKPKYRDPRLPVLCSKFVDAHRNLLSPTRMIIKEGFLGRKATIRTVDRHCILFDDLFCFCKWLDSKKEKLQLKQVVPLQDLEVLELPGKPCHFSIKTSERTFVVEAPDPDEREMWTCALRATVAAFVDPRILAARELAYVRSGQTAEETETGIDLQTMAETLQITLPQATIDGDIEAVRTLLKTDNYPVDEVDDDGYTALHLAIKNGAAEIAEVLVNHGADCVKPDPKGQTPLHLAAFYGYSNILELLFEEGVDADIKNGDGKTAFELCAEGCDEEWVGGCLEVLCENQCSTELVDTQSGDNILHKLCELNREEALDTLLHQKYGSLSVHVVNYSTGKTPLHTACLFSSVECAKILIRYGAYPNVRDNNMCTPLHYCSDLNLGCVLVAHGGRPDIQDANGIPADHQLLRQPETKQHIDQARQNYMNRPKVAAKKATQDSTTWVNDNATDSCMLCSQTFSFMNRRHHCRHCSLLVCGACSKKQYHDKSLNQDCRCCDGCFNLLTHRAQVYAKRAKARAERLAKQQAIIDAKEEKRRKEQEEYDRKTKEMKEKVRQAKERMEAKRAARTAPSQLAGPSARAHEVQNRMNENIRLAQERGEMLDQMKDKSDEMANRAKGFAEMARKLKKKNQSSWL